MMAGMFILLKNWKPPCERGLYLKSSEKNAVTDSAVNLIISDGEKFL